jgi:hypothetical protein
VVVYLKKLGLDAIARVLHKFHTGEASAGGYKRDVEEDIKAKDGVSV